MLTVGSFNLVRPPLAKADLRRLEHLSFGGGFANKGLHLLFPLLNLRSLHITVRPAGEGVCVCDLGGGVEGARNVLAVECSKACFTLMRTAKCALHIFMMLVREGRPLSCQQTDCYS